MSGLSLGSSDGWGAGSRAGVIGQAPCQRVTGIGWFYPECRTRSLAAVGDGVKGREAVSDRGFLF